MTLTECTRCRRTVDPISSLEIEGLIYCAGCAEEAKQSVKAKKVEVQKEKKEILRERDAIEQEMRTITEEDTQHITVSTTDTLEIGQIIDYIDVISVQDVVFQDIHINPVQAEGQHELAEKLFRNRIELSLSKLRKRAYLVGADAVVGVHIDSSMEQKPESEYTLAVAIKLNITGTAVRLTTHL
ncbi:MAG: heavy metal-binding domain-containing protein [Desulfobacterales bacterium]|jgi:uncharacterized protein YbjQ (UPF0145 family)